MSILWSINNTFFVQRLDVSLGMQWIDPICLCVFGLPLCLAMQSIAGHFWFKKLATLSLWSILGEQSCQVERHLQQDFMVLLVSSSCALLLFPGGEHSWGCRSLAKRLHSSQRSLTMWKSISPGLVTSLSSHRLRTSADVWVLSGESLGNPLL